MANNQQPADSWEDGIVDDTRNMRIEGQSSQQQGQGQSQGLRFNPNARGFNPGAGSFVPGQYAQQPYYGQNQQQQYQQPGQYNQKYQQPAQNNRQYQQPSQYQHQGYNQNQSHGGNGQGYHNNAQQGGGQQSSGKGQGRGGYYGSQPPAQNQPRQQQYTSTSTQQSHSTQATSNPPVLSTKPVVTNARVEKPEKKEEKSSPAVDTKEHSEKQKERDQRKETTPAPALSGAEKAALLTGSAVAPVVGKVKKNARNDLGIEHLNMVFIGHVDAGKSTIGGQIMFLTGGVDARTLEKYEKEAAEANRGTWYLAWCIDTNQEERDKGKTVEVGRANFMTEKKKFTVLDAPGHKSFVPNMISGTAQADIAVLVVSARKGEFEAGFDRSGQTREHAMLAKTAGVKHLIVLVNKMDDPSVEWDVERYKQICRDISPFLKKCGYTPKQVHFMPASGLTGLNIQEAIPPGVFDFYKGKPLLSYLDELPPVERLNEWHVRMPINERFKDMGTVVMGKLESGVIERGDSLVLMPNKINCEVAEIYDDDEEVDFASAGSNIRLKLKGLDEGDITIGHVLCAPEALCPVVREFDAQIVLLDVDHIVAAGFNCVVHVHATVEEVRFKALIATIDRKTGQIAQKKPRFAKQDQIIIARLECTQGILCVESFKTLAKMGRFTLRDKGKTIGIGKIVKLVS
eukprot:CFRG1811T1